MSLYKDYNNYVKKRRPDSICSPQEFHRACRPEALKRHRVLRNFLEPPKVILEIGSSTGAFLELLKHKQCYGVEYADQNREYSRQFAKGVYADISEVPKNKRFDIICMFHVLEHIDKPIEFIKKCKSHLARDGKFLIEVPHIDDPLISLYNCRDFKDFYFQPIHPYVYSLRSLEYVFSKAGLKSKQVIYYQRYGLDNHLAWLSRGRPGGDKLFSELFGSNSHYIDSLCKIKKTDTIFYIAERDTLKNPSKSDVEL